MNGVNVSLFYRNERIAFEVFPAAPRAGEVVRLPDERKFRVDEVEWGIISGCATTPGSVSARAHVEHVCDRCYAPMDRERLESVLCPNCEEAEA